jgi:multidrug efflux pump subunit AcrB
MTSLAISLGALPIAMSGAASTSRIGMGVVIVGGTIFLSSNFICYSCTLFYVV